MNKSPAMLLLTVLVMILTAVPACHASRPGRTPYQECQKLLEKLTAHVDKMAEEEKYFPPRDLRVDPQTGAIPMGVLVEQALVDDLDRLRQLFPSCRYVLAPWALPGDPGRPVGKGRDIYCACHGFLDYLNHEEGDFATPASVRGYFIAGCQKHGIDHTVYERELAAFNPDFLNVENRDFMHRNFIKLIHQVSPFGILAFQAMLALVGGALFLRRSGGWRGNLWAGLVTAASLWVGLQTVYLVLFRQVMIEGRLLFWTPALQKLLGMQELMCLLLFLFFIVSIFVFRKSGRSTGPLPMLIFASASGILFSNFLTGLLGLWGFYIMLQSTAPLVQRKSKE